MTAVGAICLLTCRSLADMLEVSEVFCLAMQTILPIATTPTTPMTIAYSVVIDRELSFSAMTYCLRFEKII